MQTEKPRQPLQNSGKANFEAHKSAVERAVLESRVLNAIPSRDYAGLRQSLARGADPNILNAAFMTPLLRAAELGETKICALLLLYGADLFARTTFKSLTTNEDRMVGGLTASQLAENPQTAKLLGFMESLGKEAYMSFISDFRECISGGL
jgi:ankyrin repeat protein